MSGDGSVMAGFALPEKTEVLAKYKALFESGVLKSHPDEAFLRRTFTSAACSTTYAATITMMNAKVTEADPDAFIQAQIDMIYEAHELLTPDEKRGIEADVVCLLGSAESHAGQTLVLMMDYDNCGFVLCSSSLVKSYRDAMPNVRKSHAKIQYFIDVAIRLGYKDVIFQNASTRQYINNDALNEHNLVKGMGKGWYSTGRAITLYPQYAAALNLIHGDVGIVKYSHFSAYDIRDGKEGGYHFSTEGIEPDILFAHDKSDMIQTFMGHYSALNPATHCVFMDDYPKKMKAGQESVLVGSEPDNVRLTCIKYDMFSSATGEKGGEFPPAMPEIEDSKAATFETYVASLALASPAADDTAVAGAGAGGAPLEPDLTPDVPKLGALFSDVALTLTPATSPIACEGP